MKLSQCRHGVLVCTLQDSDEGEQVEYVGMVVGIGECLGDPVPLVQWQYSLEPSATPHELLSLYEE